MAHGFGNGIPRSEWQRRVDRAYLFLLLMGDSPVWLPPDRTECLFVIRRGAQLGVIPDFEECQAFRVQVPESIEELRAALRRRGTEA